VTGRYTWGMGQEASFSCEPPSVSTTRRSVPPQLHPVMRSAIGPLNFWRLCAACCRALSGSEAAASCTVDGPQPPSASCRPSFLYGERPSDRHSLLPPGGPCGVPGEAAARLSCTASGPPIAIPCCRPGAVRRTRRSCRPSFLYGERPSDRHSLLPPRGPCGVPEGERTPERGKAPPGRLVLFSGGAIRTRIRRPRDVSLLPRARAFLRPPSGPRTSR